VGQSLNDLVQDSDRVRVSALLKRAISGARIEMQNMRLLGADGPSPLLSMTGYFLPDLKGRYFLGFRLGAAPSFIAARDGVACDTESGLMDAETYEQMTLPRDILGESAGFLQDGMEVTVDFIEGKPVAVQLPPTVTMTITEADPVVKGQTASSSYKPAVLENGMRIMVPPHIAAGTRVVVNTADGTYAERAKD